MPIVSSEEFLDKEWAKKVTQISGKTWIDKVKFAVDKAIGTKSLKAISLEQWINSRLCYLVAPNSLNEAEMLDYFSMIDADLSGNISMGRIH
jgi:hypothetical protein